jgi:hypothetical protein
MQRGQTVDVRLDLLQGAPVEAGQAGHLVAPRAVLDAVQDGDLGRPGGDDDLAELAVSDRVLDAEVAQQAHASAAERRLE